MRGFFCLEDLEVGLCNDEDSLSAYEDCHSDDVDGLSDDGDCNSDDVDCHSDDGDGLSDDVDGSSDDEDGLSDDVDSLSDDGFKESYDYYKLLLTFYSFSNKNSNGI